jgi:cytoskeletal protein CcmA (bactofilin family)
MFKGKLETNAVAVMQPDRSSTVDQHVATLVATPVSCIGSGMSIVGNVECSGPMQVFGRIEGELRATELVIGEGAQIEGAVQAQEVTVSGRVKGTIRAIRVRLQGATVEGDIIHRTLSIDESTVFEGNSRRVENPVERRADNSAEASANGKGTSKKAAPGPVLVPSAMSAGNGAQPN